ncbi:hypothetical protein A3D00_02235 [Candidatus Woesebacteria bacterium RIFCSPHIGHO2_02_FULL_38_9]|uniref:Glycosyl transferase family 1 domain-containing protein n=1 Tax=Candidatus Woesebacteria bacterium RIFCSPHIGHO2_01_FULL_39_28 TaxID=1802496 RepID=A0A1F7YG98_9BACT|nr:MAG: hypothetical protein A2627_02175 [Candidatus Woesebacteria bacterium RIFCSPHIGHO2_01_FULL_39_28]OGM32783.1 MAG: hypothetical protein A3D00_02235 [Candidatus Woesebacteria bacterium RIFCSPHIGHO2_02_FULL_38_9]OGM58142.1 MAG: hypothetical protein A3A50_00055 [Candidatus Woesebacteria bacterium RIFCSPLOWO2_01_FULL_38_20]
MKAAIYDPYLDTLGGGERYMITAAQVLSENGYKVDVEWRDQSIKDKLEDRFGIKIDKLNFVNSINRGSFYDVCFWLSDGSIPTLLARKNFLHFQRPFSKAGGKSLLNRMKLIRVSGVVVNSKFTKRWIDKEYGVESVVIYPPVMVDKFRPKKKEKIILYVGRFSQLEQAKRQDVLIEAFKKLYRSKGNIDFSLVLAGSSDVGKTDFIDRLLEKSKNFPIKILENPSFKDLKEIYSRALVFWSAAGFGINEKKEPQRLEHFGISLVEAMASGAVPIAYSGGGHREIIDPGINGFLWRDEHELLSSTTNLLRDKRLLKKMSSQAKIDSQKFNLERFKREFEKLL